MDDQEKILVEITFVGKNCWYFNKLGDVIEVTEFSEWFYEYRDKGIAKIHCTVVDEDSLAEAGTGGCRL